MESLTPLDCEPLATRRTFSLLEEDVDAHHAELSAALVGSSVVVIGAAGSIGSAVVKSLLAFRLSALALIDLNENNLTELVRDVRASDNVCVPTRFAALPIAMGSPECRRFFSEATPFDYVFNLCALKHVRSEKDVFSLMRMIDTNVLCLDETLKLIPPGRAKAFSVSTDKAANPVSLMGASKRLMELVLHQHADRNPFSTARFANVAFSDGSLPFGFLKRIEKRQPIAAPSDIRRFFISHREAGQLCLLAGVLGANQEIFFPKLERGIHERTFCAIAKDLLEKAGYDPFECVSEEEARSLAPELIPKGKWPCLFTPSDTAGEKPYEEFYSEGDAIDWNRFRAIGVVTRTEGRLDPEALAGFIDFAKGARQRPVSKAEYLEAFSRVLPNFRHLEKDRNLDDKL